MDTQVTEWTHKLQTGHISYRMDTKNIHVHQTKEADRVEVGWMRSVDPKVLHG